MSVYVKVKKSVAPGDDVFLVTAPGMIDGIAYEGGEFTSTPGNGDPGSAVTERIKGANWLSELLPDGTASLGFPPWQVCVTEKEYLLHMAAIHARMKPIDFERGLAVARAEIQARMDNAQAMVLKHFTISGAARLAKVSRTTIYAWVKAGYLVPVQKEPMLFLEADIVAAMNRERLKGGRGRKRP